MTLNIVKSLPPSVTMPFAFAFWEEKFHVVLNNGRYFGKK